MAVQQARWNAHIGTPCEFRLLNSPSGRSSGPLVDGVDFLRIDPERGNASEQSEALSQMLDRVQPFGPTPLVDRITDIHRRVGQERDALARSGQRVVLIIATDGLPTSANRGSSGDRDRTELAGALRNIAQSLPVHLVIRLTTNDDSVVQFYNDLDEELEIPLEVLDDIESEAQEIWNKGNGWLTYSPVLHTLREQGTFVKLFDLLDERRLTSVEAMVLARLLLQEEEATDALPQRPEDFCRYAVERLRSMPRVYDPMTKQNSPVLRVNALYNAMVPLSQRMMACCAKRRQGAPSLQRAFVGWLRGMVDRATMPAFDSHPHQRLT